MIDTHCHLTYQPLLGQVESVLQRAAQAGVDRMITVGTSPDDARQAAALAQAHASVFATVGLHPHYADQWRDEAMVRETMLELSQQPKVVALGEMGLDRHYADPPIDSQRRALQWQLDVARQSDLPVIIHNREATDEILAILRDSGISPGRFVFHCFTGQPAELEAVLTFGGMVSFTGIVTFRSARALGESTAMVPENRIMIETDSPYLTPEPHRKVKTNEPCYVPHVAAYVAGVRGMDVNDFIALSDANAERFFRLPG
jgi:TatD DNase family protein